MLPVAVCIYTDACTHFVVVGLDCDHMMREAVILLAVLLTMLFVHSLNPSTRQTEMGGHLERSGFQEKMEKCLLKHTSFNPVSISMEIDHQPEFCSYL